MAQQIKQKKFPDRNQGRSPRQDQEYDQKVLDIARVARVVAGGRRFSFRASIALGDKKGKVGIGVGKGADVSLAINKAVRQAKKALIKVPMTDAGTLPYEIKGKQTGSVVLLKPSRRGRGIIAGGSVRVICGLAGYKDITTKILSRSTNKLNIALATINALKQVKDLSSMKSNFRRPELKSGEDKKIEVKDKQKKAKIKPKEEKQKINSKEIK